MRLNSAARFAAEHGSHHIPGLRRIPVIRLLMAAELIGVANRHLHHLTPAERHRLMELLRHPRNLSRRERAERNQLLHKLDTRAFAGSAAQRLSPLPLPRRLTRARY